MSLCKAFTEGWIGHYIDTVRGAQDRVDPLVTPLSPPSSFPASSPTAREAPKLRWSAQFLHQDQTKCGPDACRGPLLPPFLPPFLPPPPPPPSLPPSFPPPSLPPSVM
jgi:hypothetical protein